MYLATGLKTHDWLVDPSKQVDAMKVKIPAQKYVVDGFRGVAKVVSKLSGRTSSDAEAEKLAYKNRLEEARLAESQGPSQSAGHRYHSVVYFRRMRFLIAEALEFTSALAL